MEIIRYDRFLNERMKVMPITNDEFDKVGFDIDIVGIGDDLEDGDVVVVGYEDIQTKYYRSIKIGVYNSSEDRIIYGDVSIRYRLLKQTFTWDYNNRVRHHILLIYRPRDGKATIDFEQTNDEKLNRLDDNRLFKPVYRNDIMAKNFGL